jgi:nitrate reductase NapE component
MDPTPSDLARAEDAAKRRSRVYSDPEGEGAETEPEAVNWPLTVSGVWLAVALVGLAGFILWG